MCLDAGGLAMLPRFIGGAKCQPPTITARVVKSFFYDNSAYQDGGAIIMNPGVIPDLHNVSKSPALEVDGCMFEGNWALGYGGERVLKSFCSQIPMMAGRLVFDPNTITCFDMLSACATTC